jgi:hypothetical protein
MQQRETLELFFYAAIGIGIAMLPLRLLVKQGNARIDYRHSKFAYAEISGVVVSVGLFWLIWQIPASRL